MDDDDDDDDDDNDDDGDGDGSNLENDDDNESGKNNTLIWKRFQLFRDPLRDLKSIKMLMFC